MFTAKLDRGTAALNRRIWDYPQAVAAYGRFAGQRVYRIQVKPVTGAAVAPKAFGDPLVKVFMDCPTGQSGASPMDVSRRS